MIKRFVALALALSLATTTHAASADDPVIAAATDLTGDVLFLESGAPGMILVVVRGDGTFIRGYGETEKGNSITPDGTSLVRLNSITKVFTTEVLASLATERKLSLADPLQSFAPQAKVPAFEGRPITLLDLATYSGALPREMGHAPEGTNPRAWPTRDDRWSWLGQYSLPWAPAPSRPTRMWGSTSWPMRSGRQAARPMRTCCAATSPRPSECRIRFSRRHRSNAPC